MIATIEEMTANLEDILTLARVGRSREAFETFGRVRIARAVAQEYRDMGQPVTFASTGPNHTDAQPNLLRRAIRNLVDNALKYAGTAEIDVRGGEAM